jgi:signal transduction histidine kinase
MIETIRGRLGLRTRGWGGWRRATRVVRGPWVALLVAVLVAGVGVAGSVMFHQWWDHTIETQNSDRLDRSINSRLSRATDNLTRYADVLRAVGALVQSGTGVPQGHADQFDMFVRGLDIPHRYTALQAIGWQIPVAGSHVVGLVNQLRKTGNRTFTINPAGPRSRYAVLVYQHTIQPVTATPGDDRLADPGIAAVLDHTRDTGEPGLAPSPHAADRNAGVFLLFLPIYRPADAGTGDGRPATVPARRAALLGWMSAQIHAEDFLNEALSGIAAGNAGVQLLDDQRLIAVDPDGFHPTGTHVRTADLPMAGRVWQLRLAPLPGSILIQDADPADAIGLYGGIALSLLLAAMSVMIAAQARTTRALRTANQRSADMVAMLSHDARQPLTTIINYSQLVLDDWHHLAGDTISGDPAASTTDSVRPALEDVPASLGRVIGAANRLNHLVDDVLATARLDAIPTHNTRPVQVEQIIAEAVSDSGAPGMLIDTTAVQAVWVQADPTHLRQIIANLIGNALKYGAPPVTVATRATGQHVSIEVGDAGPGVPAEFIKQLFDRFSRATSTATTTHGSGFGLYIVQRLAQANSGQITYQPGQPSGACFTVTLPAANLTPAETAHLTA